MSLTSSKEAEYLKGVFGEKCAPAPPAELVGDRGFNIGLAGLNAIVTGGTKGIGRACVDMLAESGANVAFCARNKAEVDEAVAAVKQLNPNVKVYGAALDMSSPAENIAAFVEAAANHLGGVDICISNAAALAIGPSVKAFEANFRVDILGCLALFNAALPHFKKSRAPSFVAVSSTAARQADEPNSYGAMKAGLIHLVKGFAGKYAALGIRSNALSPGTTIFPGGSWENNKARYPPVFAGALARNPTGRMATAREVARATLFLASPAASFITGTNLIIDGSITRGVSL
ncbi:hypothetical protein DFJ74DRAFT_696862 [Hyaloraphidium curvatum]|nr:hypothetical protein DFJ74DRAFT_696862 [Hyaloraphidium curvatum]